MQIALARRSVSEHAQPGRIVEELAHEVEHVAVRVARAQQRDEAEGVALEAVAFAERRHQALARHLRRAVERGLDGNRAGLGRWKDVGFAQRGGRRREDDPAHVRRPHRLQHVERGDRVLLQVAARLREPAPDIGIRREVPHDVDARQQWRQQRLVEQVAFDQAKVRLCQRIVEKPTLAGREIVDPDHPVAERQQAVGERAADESGRTRDEVDHRAASASAAPGAGRLSASAATVPAQK